MSKRAIMRKEEFITMLAHLRNATERTVQQWLRSVMAARFSSLVSNNEMPARAGRRSGAGKGRRPETRELLCMNVKCKL